MMRTTLTLFALAISTLLPAQQRREAGQPVRPDQVAAPRAQRDAGPEANRGPRTSRAGVQQELARLRQRLEQLRVRLDRLEGAREGASQDPSPQRRHRGQGARRGARMQGGKGRMQRPQVGALLGRLRDRWQAMRGPAGQGSAGPGHQRANRGQQDRGRQAGGQFGPGRGGPQRASQMRGPQGPRGPRGGGDAAV
jgi:hypothetical protein